MIVDETYRKDILKKALEIAVSGQLAQESSAHLKRTTQRTITKRGVIWLGQTCNLHCQFCYFFDKIHSKEHPEHAFMSLDKAKKICRALVEFYGNKAVDIQGGEPTIYNDIFELIRYCSDIGLRPTLITNGLVLDDIEVCRKYKEVGLRDFLISVHGIGEVYDRLVRRDGAHVRQMIALRNLREVGIPFRFNCVLSKPATEQLSLIAELAIRTGALVVNFIAFNPFEDQSRQGRRSTTNVPRYPDVKEKITEALDILESAGIETNVRYLPICMLEDRHRKSAYNFQQLPYDHHEWDYASWGWTGLQPQRMSKGDLTDPVHTTALRWLPKLKGPFKNLASISVIRPLLYEAYEALAKLSGRGERKEDLYRKIATIHAEIHCRYTYGENCKSCKARGICDGFHGDYAQIFGADEAEPIESELRVADPIYYIRNQMKIVEEDDKKWALPPLGE